MLNPMASDLVPDEYCFGSKEDHGGSLHDIDEGLEVAEEAEREDEDDEFLVLMPLSSGSRGPETPDEEVSSSLESDHVLEDISEEVPRERHLLIAKNKKVMKEQWMLQLKNQYLEHRVYLYKKKASKLSMMMHRIEVSYSNRLDHSYQTAMASYKSMMEELEARQDEMHSDLLNIEKGTRIMHEEDTELCRQLFDRLRQVAENLVFAQSGRRLTKAAIEALINRQVQQRDNLMRIRIDHSLNCHQYQDITRRLRLSFDYAGSGLRMDGYEALLGTNQHLKENLERKNQEVEKLHSQIRRVMSIIAHYKETESCLHLDILERQKVLNELRQEALTTREALVNAHKNLFKLKKTYNEKKQLSNIFLMSPVMLKEMAETKRALEDLKAEVNTSGKEARPSRDDAEDRRKRGAGISVTRMTKFKRSTSKPGRC